LFWWWTVRFLLDGRIGWRALLPAALATGFCLTGLAVFSLLLFSGSVISGENSYGPIGVVLVLLYYLIGAGVCLLLGAVFGQMWSERHQPPGSTRLDSFRRIVFQAEAERQVEQDLGVGLPLDLGKQRFVHREHQVALDRGEAVDEPVVHEQPAAMPERMAVRLLNGRPDRRADVREEHR
jgi:hypothetical protein